MPEPEYTPGPWDLDEPPEWNGSYHEFPISVEEGRDIIANVFGSLSNAHVISASPDTLESLIEVLPIAEGLLIRDCSESGEDMPPEDAAKFERAHKAIAKAKGETDA